MLIKQSEQVIVPGTPAKFGQAYARVCFFQTHGGGGGGTKPPPPHPQCQTVYTYGPYDPQSGGQNVIGIKTVCWTS